MNTATKENLIELREFLHTQATDDAAMPAEDRRHQAEVVSDVVAQEHLKPTVEKTLLKEYFGEVADLVRA